MLRNNMKKSDFKNKVTIPKNIKVLELGFVNAYLIKGNGEFLLVDTGLSKMWPELEKSLVDAGCLPDKLKLVILTHGDSDHTGNCRILQEKYKAKIAMHADDQAIVDSGFSGKRKMKSRIMRIMFFAIRLLRLLKLMGAANKFKANIYLHDGQDLKEYGFAASIIHLPGHTRGSIAVLTEAGDLFIGDTMVNRKKPEPANIIENEGELRRSMAKLGKYDIKRVYPGHGYPFLMTSLEEFLNP
jgi:glyoxylase-like metal-dependent hydrolase (beta-lactamase superfamily II)